MKDPVAVSYGFSLGRQKGFASGSIVGMDEVVLKQMKRVAQMVVNASNKDDSPDPADDQGPAGTRMKDDDGGSVYSGMGGWEMGSESAIFPEH